MKKILVSFLLIMFAICGTFAKEKKSETKENLVEVTSSEFFYGKYSIKKDIVYKIISVGLSLGITDYVYICDVIVPDSVLNSITKILTKEEKERIKRANQYDKFKTNYIIFVQAKKNNPILSDLKIIKVEGIPTEPEIDAEEKRLDDERERLEAARIAEEKEKQAKFEKHKEELTALFVKSGKEGFDNMPWGTDVDFFLWENPNAEKIEDEGSIQNWEVKKAQNTKIYKFHEGKLVGGITIYSNADKTLADDINHRLAELYGKPSDKKDLGGHKTENVLGYYISYYDMHLRVVWNKSSTFKVQLDVTAKQLDSGYDIMDRMLLNQSPNIAITYSNEKKMTAIKASDEKKKKAAEAEAQRQRMDNLGL